MTRTPGLHDPNVPTDEWAERVDTDRHHYPTRAELADRPEFVMPKRVVEPCVDCEHVLCALQRAAERRAS